jgi:hypothetical protein
MSPWVPIVVAVISIIPGLLAWQAARGARAQVTTNHGKRLGEYVELIAEKTNLLELKMETQHAELGSKVDQLAEDLRLHMDEEQQARVAASRAVGAALGLGATASNSARPRGTQRPVRAS